MKKYLLFSYLVAVIINCSVPESQSSTKKSSSMIRDLRNTAPFMQSEPVPYRDYQSLGQSIWESEDKKVRVQFNPTGNQILLTYDGQPYYMNAYSYNPETYQQGFFTMESNPQTTEGDINPWTIILVVKPETKDQAGFLLFSGSGINIEGKLTRISS